jgi:hypothetical protein
MVQAPAGSPTGELLQKPPPQAKAQDDAGAPVVRAPDLPFHQGEVWKGTYVCAQGETQLSLVIWRVDGPDIDAIFDFRHDASGAAGQYNMHGAYRPDSRRLRLAADDWIAQPPGYVTVDLDGRVRDDAFEGKVVGPSCTSFALRRAR